MLLTKATAVVAMRDVHRGATDSRIIGLRHDVDDNAGSLDTAVALAHWQAERGYHATYYLLHGSHYWDTAPETAAILDGLGHEVGLHVNAIAESIRTGDNQHVIVAQALSDLRAAAPIVGCVAHGDQLCHTHRFVNDEIFTDCPRPGYGSPTRNVGGVKIDPRPLSDFNLLYEANRLSRGDYLSDSGCRWSQPFEEVAEAFPARGQLHILQHPDWWAEAFAPVAEAAA
jgi:hypothetical protein